MAITQNPTSFDMTTNGMTANVRLVDDGSTFVKLQSDGPAGDAPNGAQISLQDSGNVCAELRPSAGFRVVVVTEAGVVYDSQA